MEQGFTLWQLNLSIAATVSYANASTVTVFEEDGATLLCFVVETAIERRGLTLHLSVDSSQATMSADLPLKMVCQNCVLDCRHSFTSDLQIPPFIGMIRLGC